MAQLNLASLPGSMVSRLGLTYGASFFQYVDRSSHEFVFVHREADRIMAGCVLSLDPSSLGRRLLLRTPVLLWAPLRVRKLRLGGLLRSGRRDRTPRSDPTSYDDRNTYDHLPEMILIFSDANWRGRGLGAKLLSRCERLLLDRGHDRYVIKTDDDPTNRALSFYHRHGFVLRRRFTKFGMPYLLYEKSLIHEAVD